MTDRLPFRHLPDQLQSSGSGAGDWIQPSMLDLVQGLTDGSITPTVPKHAATVMLLRDGTEGLLVYLLRRAQTMAFAAGMTVFPGGSVDPRDEELPGAAFAGADLAAWSPALGADRALTAALVCAAVRETFEESGVLLAGPDGSEVVADTSGDDWEADRLALLDRSLSMAALLTRRGLVLRADRLRPWAHWITPEVESRRYDTRFFVAAMPAGQRTRHVGGEADRVCWRRPADALAAAAHGEVGILPPTEFALTELASFGTVNEVMTSGPRREIKTVQPRLVIDNGSLKLQMPDDFRPAV